MKITFFAADGCFSSGITSLLDMFAIANMWQTSLTGNRQPLFVTEIATVDGAPALGSGCIQLLAHRPLEAVDDSDFILLPPFIPLPEPSAEGRGVLNDWLIAQHQKRTPIAAMCTGVFLLAETGLLNGRKATTNWQFARKFRRTFPEVHLHTEHLVTEDDGLLCTGAATANFNLGLRIIARYGSDELASTCAKALLLDPNRESQAPYYIFRREREHGDAEIEKAQRYLEDNFSGTIMIDEVAGHVRISPRHFKRRFKEATGSSPVQYLQMVRIEAARKKLETTLSTIDEITRQIGYEDSSTFRRLFKQHTNLSPREYRDKFLRV
ncbi:MAG: helix-turn-helix domain-containing protein [Desulforhopalus sp.]|nr:helix-turn-helix domain-containing protein [Desulforhopalus sp.]